MNMEDWELHVVKDMSDSFGTSWCGVKLGSVDFGLQGADHAKLCVEKDTRTQPCPACWNLIKEVQND
jgi:hypothetical protein